MIDGPPPDTGSGVRVGILGPLLVTVDGRPAAVAGDRLRTLLARLAADAGRPVRGAELIDAVWGERAPAGPDNALQTLVSRLRRALPPGTVTAEPGGYRLVAAVDADDFDAAVHAARAAADPASTATAYGHALALWRGPVLDDLPEASFARGLAARLAEARTVATEEWLAARLAVESPEAVTADLEALAAAHPVRERVHALLIRALAGAGRQANAVDAYQRIRAHLADELGLDPSPDLAEAYRSMLAGAAAGNLRPALTSFVGRTADLARLTATLREHRLVTLVGPGGAGKTRLAVEAGRALAASFDGGVWMVELAPVREGAGVARALADALHIRDIRFLDLSAGADVLDKLLGVLTAKRMLLVLDNCEHLIDACARLVEPVLAACPGVHVLATSREPLALTGEALLPVGPLPVPVAGASAADARTTSAVELFTQRAATVRPGFAVSNANVSAVGEICRRLDGMPLAIELACARLRTMPVETVADRLDDRFRLLTGGSRTALPRHQTLQAVVDWSWDLLSAPERDLAGRFSVFLDGATWDTVAGLHGPDAGQTLSALVDKSFVQLGDDGRYRMLETIRTYAAERLADTGTAADARTAHARYFADTAGLADQHMRDAGQTRWMRWLSDERDNLSGALRWAIDTGDAETALRIVGSLGWFWMLCDYHVEAAAWFDEALALPGPTSPDARAVALSYYATTLMATGDRERVDAALAEAGALGSDHPMVALGGAMAGMFGDDLDRAARAIPALRDHPDPWVRGMGATIQAVVDIFRGDAAAAEAGFLDALSRFEAIGDRWAQATLSSGLAEMRAMRGDPAGALDAFRSAARTAEELGVPEVAAGVLMSLALHEERSGDLDSARRHLRRAQEYARRGVSAQTAIGMAGAEAELEYRHGRLDRAREMFRTALAAARRNGTVGREITSGMLHGLAHIEIAQGNLGAARDCAVEIDAMSAGPAGRIGMSMCAAVAMSLAVAAGDPGRAAYLIGIARAIRGLDDAGTPEVLAATAAARAALGDAGFDAEYTRGATLPYDEAVAALRHHWSD